LALDASAQEREDLEREDLERLLARSEAVTMSVGWGERRNG
jgi:hypothetical protein